LKKRQTLRCGLRAAPLAGPTGALGLALSRSLYFILILHTLALSVSRGFCVHRDSCSVNFVLCSFMYGRLHTAACPSLLSNALGLIVIEEERLKLADRARFARDGQAGIELVADEHVVERGGAAGP